MNNTIKKILCLLMSFVLLFAVAGCSEMDSVLSDLVKIAEELEKNTDSDLSDLLPPTDDSDASFDDTKDDEADDFTESNKGSDNSSDKNTVSSETASGNSNPSSATSNVPTESKEKTIRMMMWRELNDAEKKLLIIFKNPTI